MTEIFIVTENNGESYEDSHSWNVAAFTNLEDADKYAAKAQADFDVDFKEALEISREYEREEKSLVMAMPWDIELSNEANNENNEEIVNAIYDYLGNKYLPTFYDSDCKHTFSVSAPLPFNP